MKFSFDIRYSLFDILRFKKPPELQRLGIGISAAPASL
jgi:hypothetical protein